MKFNQIIFGLSILAIVFSGCKKEEEEVLPPQDDHHHHHDGHGEVALHFHHVINGNDVSLGEQYTLNGLDVVFTRIQYYIHDITFYADHDGDESLTLDGKYLLVGAGANHFELGDIEMGHVHMMSFKIGVDPVTNSQSEAEFLARPASDPLSAQNPPMHWSWAVGSGYKFAAFEGTFGDDSDNFVYHTATDDLLRETGMMTVHIDLDHDAVNEINVKLNLATVFNGVDIAANPTSHGANPTNVTLSDNLSGAFSVMP
jgi:hypothetical protein